MRRLAHRLRRLISLPLALCFLILSTAPVLALDKVHVVQRGDTLASIARRFDISISQLAAYNGIDSSDFIFVGQQVLVPNEDSPLSSPTGSYLVRVGDSLSDIARSHSATAEKLREINGLAAGEPLWVGQRLLVPVTPRQTETVTHRVQFGETLHSIARRYGSTWQGLAIYNGLRDPRRLAAGQVLRIPSLDVSRTLTSPPSTAKPAPQAALPTLPEQAIASSQVYALRLGESLSTVARKFGFSLEDLLQVNGLSLDSPVWVGQKLSLPLLPDGAEPLVEWAVPAPPAAPAAPAVTPAPVPTDLILESEATPRPPASFLHIVTPGETLNHIASKYEKKPSRVYEYNGLASRNLLEVGQRLNIPLDMVGDPGFVGKRWVEIDLSEQLLTAWNGDELFLQTEISSGLANTPTPVGLFRVWHMNPSQTMSGPGYSLPNVKFNMYFFSGYAMHGAYWHDNFGNPMSHGCVNMRNEDAELLYGFASLGMEVWVHN